MEKNYYPLRAVISDENSTDDYTIVDANDDCIAIYVDRKLAQQIVDAYNEKYGVWELDMGKVESIAAKFDVSPKKALQIFLDIKLAYKKMQPENAAHSFTEGSDSNPSTEKHETPWLTLQQQIEFVEYKRACLENSNEEYGASRMYQEISENLQAVKRWRESQVMHDIECEKVIGDLCDYVRETQSHTPPCLQNGEAALGMLRALKEKRDKREFKCHAQIQKEEYHLPDEGRIEFKKVTSSAYGRDKEYFDAKRASIHDRLAKIFTGEATSVMLAIEDMIELREEERKQNDINF